MNKDLTGNQYPPPGFQAEGSVTVGSTESGTIIIDSMPTEGSSNAVSSGGAHAALEEREPTIAPVEVNPTDYVWAGNKTWRPLLTWVQQLLDEYVEVSGFSWDEITGKPDNLITEESDPTVPDYVKNLTEEQVEALEWLTAHFPREGLTPGAVLTVGGDGETIVQKSFGEMLAVFFPGLTAVLTGVVSAPTTISAIQQGFDVKISWTDIERTAGYYPVEVRARVDGVWGEWQMINQDDYTLKQHIWTQENIPAGMTDVGARVRYINSQNQASAWTSGQTAYDEEEEVINETTYEIVPGTTRWWQEDTTIPNPEGETTYEIVAASTRWYSAESITPPEPAKPNPPVISVLRWNTNTIDVKVADTNVGKADSFEFNYREVGTNAWYTLKSDGSLNLSSASPLLALQANNNNTWNLTMSITNALFLNKRIESRVRTYVDSVASDWSTIVQEPGTVAPAGRVMGVRTAKINIQKIDGLWSDTESDNDGGKLAHYYVNGVALKGAGGSRIKFENVSFRAGLLIEVSKVFLDTAFFDSWADYEANHWQAAIGTGNEDKIGFYCQHNFITY